MIGRPIQFDPDIALESAMQLFWSKGYNPSSLQMLIEAMGISKSSFYQVFKSKHNLFCECIELYAQQKMDDMESELSHANSGREFIQAYFHNILEEAVVSDMPRGGLLSNTANELSQSDEKVALLVCKGFEGIISFFELVLKQAQQQGDIGLNKDARILAVYLVNNVSGLRVMIKSGMSSEQLKHVVEIVLHNLD